MITVYVFTTPNLGEEAVIPKDSGKLLEIKSLGWVTIESDDPVEVEILKTLFPGGKEVRLAVNVRYPDAIGAGGKLETHMVWHRRDGVGFGNAI